MPTIDEALHELHEVMAAYSGTQQRFYRALDRHAQLELETSTTEQVFEEARREVDVVGS